MSLGLARAGFKHAIGVDNDENAIATYRKNIGEPAVVADARSISGATLLRLAELGEGAIDLVVGGPPCQGFSVQRRHGASDERNDLLFEFARLIEDIAPRLFLMENVPSLRNNHGRQILDRFLRIVQDLGYEVEMTILNAADYGVPQNRRRLFVVGRKAHQTAPFVFPAACVTPENYATVRQAIGDLPSPGTCAINNHEPDNISALNRERISHVPPGGGRESIPEELQLPCHRVSVAVAGHRGVYGRLHWDRPAGTITTKCNSFTRGRFAHPSEHRNISMREAARIQSFPDSFVFEGDKVSVAHQIGNAVPPALAYHLGVAMIQSLTGNTSGIKRLHQIPLDLTSLGSNEPRVAD